MQAANPISATVGRAAAAADSIYRSSSIPYNFVLTPLRCIIPHEPVVLMPLKRNNTSDINRRAQRPIAVPKRRVPLIRFKMRFSGLLDLLDCRKPHRRIPCAVASFVIGAFCTIVAAKPAGLRVSAAEDHT